ncbi:hypothetical protein GCM10010329_45900 [Streptomyces spiroverticillatus]|uniref:Uncharacterized protein n=1 Tax=Streptomyces finlayi TaxID=67296 RepID=A0A918X0G9_9ACTN|nr:DUF6479 family protein [Streptomyces finlayi]GHA17648.1 hypothetical protein GCM10010329_45900 [Streptomyces spiroverticillatus]GHC99475.1 hypothetical protein GCM10010334_43070 [Streptomyces finlayi]
MNTSEILAAEGGPSLLLIVVGVVVVLFLLGAFLLGSRRAGRKKPSEVPGRGAGAGQPPSGGSQRGETWQTIDDDPDQGNPHR